MPLGVRRETSCHPSACVSSRAIGRMPSRQASCCSCCCSCCCGCCCCCSSAVKSGSDSSIRSRSPGFFAPAWDFCQSGGYSIAGFFAPAWQNFRTKASQRVN
ncbi:unnamed protein product [Polarella glacialis]|uniref:Uncharacterized protein n=1 Tax=Polarella glacialis TaxID=89957 RepID=A0A813G8W6_POLGL|nr:unnamed protein product [Polarella glacialis]